jgi:flagellar protein FliO/FliZ
MPLRAPPAFKQSHLRLAFTGFAGMTLGLLNASLAMAQSAAPAPPLPAVGVSTSAFIQGLIGLIVIIGLLLVTLAALKRWGGQFGGVSTTGMKVISGLSVGARERILLVEVGDTWLVVGVTASQIRTLHTLPKNALPALAAPENKPAFAQWLSTVMERKRHET